MSEEQRERYRRVRRELPAAAEELRELADGFALRFPADASLILLLAEFITLERICCPFLRFSLDVEPNGGPVWLRLTGSPEVKALLATELMAS